MNTIKLILALTFLSLSFNAFSQGPRGGRPGGGPEEMIKREKQALFEKVSDLNEDQKLLLEGIYSEFQTTLEETIKEMRESGVREGRSEKIQALRAEKDALIKDVLNADQFLVYESLSRPRGQRTDQKPDKEINPEEDQEPKD